MFLCKILKQYKGGILEIYPLGISLYNKCLEEGWYFWKVSSDKTRQLLWKIYILKIYIFVYTLVQSKVLRVPYSQINYAWILFMYLKSSEVIIQSPFQIDHINIFFVRDRNYIRYSPNKCFRSFYVLLYKEWWNKINIISAFLDLTTEWGRKILNKKACWELE